MSEKKNKPGRIILIIVLLSAVCIVVFYLKDSDEKYIQIKKLYMNDFTDDGNEELLILTYNRETDKEKMKLINYSDNEEIWESEVHKSEMDQNKKRIGIINNILAVSYFC